MFETDNDVINDDFGIDVDIANPHAQTTVAFETGPNDIDVADSDLASFDVAKVAKPERSSISALENDSAHAVNPLEERVRDCLYQVIDPEIMLNIVDMGLVYAIKIETDPMAGETAILDLTLTTPMCPLTGSIESQVRQTLMGVVRNVQINWVWDPIWDLSMITEAGREQLKAIGFIF
ncbi:MAG: metal-sulfur cluster assembly factor [Bifidobacteriaceae bacterium]|jgi:metal-sulfur cluster biosynthetic enzyme|nr:metal-sulfur cluster assembly factor [Bifidobacteriaceae bacterium]